MYLFIDEPQNVRNWENAVRALHDEGFIIYLSGSSSKLLSREIATALRGRSLSYKLLPFSFAEFLRGRNASFDLERLSSRDKASLLGLFDEYAEYGGFPEVTSEKDPENRIRILDDYLNLTVYKDVVERHRIKNIAVIKWLIKTFLTSYAREHSIHKTYLILKSRGLKTSKNTLYSYVSMLEDALFIFTVPKYATSERKRDFSINKTYLCDTGYAKLAGGTKDRGYRMENIVFLELERRKKPLQAITYWKNAQQEEVDFAIQEGQTTTALIQVCENAADEKTRHREVRALLKAGKELNCKNLQIITADHEAEETANRRKIEYTPIWKWLLKNSQKK
jgi:hypothetical protein